MIPENTEYQQTMVKLKNNGNCKEGLIFKGNPEMYWEIF